MPNKPTPQDTHMTADIAVSEERLRELLTRYDFSDSHDYADVFMCLGELLAAREEITKLGDLFDNYTKLQNECEELRRSKEGWMPVNGLLPERDIDILVEQRIKHGEVCTRAKFWRPAPPALEQK